MNVFFGLLTDRACVPEYQRVEPLILVPALLMLLIQEFPLTTAWHLFFKPNYARQHHFAGFRILWEVNGFLLNSLLLHYLSKSNGFLSYMTLTICRRLLSEGLLKSLKHVWVKRKVDLFVDLDFDGWSIGRFAFHQISDCLVYWWLLKSWIISKIDWLDRARLSETVTDVDNDLRWEICCR